MENDVISHRLLQYDAQGAAAFNDKVCVSAFFFLFVAVIEVLQDGVIEDGDCARSIRVNASRSIQVTRGLDCSGTAPPPNDFFLGSHAEATHLALRATLADHLHEQHKNRARA